MNGKLRRASRSRSLCTVATPGCLPNALADGQQQAERIGQDVALAAKHLLASVIAGRVERSPPSTAPFAVLAVNDRRRRARFSARLLSDPSPQSAWWMRPNVPSQSHRSKYSQTVSARWQGPSEAPSFH